MGVHKTEYQAVVLAGGRGSRMTDLTASKPKCLLPIGNLPMIWFPLSSLKKMGFKNVIVVTTESAKTEIQAVPKRYNLDLTLDVVAFDPNIDDLGTADAIKLVHDKLTANRVVVVSGDLVTDFSFHHLFDLHCTHQSSVTALFADARACGGVDPKTADVPGPKSKFRKEPREFVGIDRSSDNRLVYLSSEADLEEELTISRTALVEHPKVTVHTNLLDAHFYIFDRWVCDFVSSDSRFVSLKGEVLPYLVGKQFSRKALGDAKCHKGPVPHFEEETPNPKHCQNTDSTGIEGFLEKLKVASSQNLTSWNPNAGTLKDAYMNRVLRCYAYVADAGTVIRANTMYSYCDVNRRAEKLVPQISSASGEYVSVHPTSKVDPKSQIGEECFVGEGTTISEKTTIKNCSFGANCFVEPKVRLVNCVLMDNVRVKSFSNLQASYICDGAVIGEKCEIKDCVVGKGHEISDGGKHSNEVIGLNESRMMEI